MDFSAYANNYFLNFVLSDLTCNQCVLQWRYVAGNNWGICPDGNGAVGCGEQEEFRSCSDIALGEGIPTPMRPVRPSVRTTTRRPTAPSTATESTQHESSETFNYVPLLVVLIIILLAACVFAIWHLNRQNNPIITKCKEYFDYRICKKKSPMSLSSKTSTLPIIISHPSLGNSLKSGQEHPSSLEATTAPVPPPRTKRHRNISLSESSPA